MYEYINCYLELRMCLVIAGCGYILPFRYPEGVNMVPDLALQLVFFSQIWNYRTFSLA